ncbi:tripartite tricarboxylate transporter TctB family protein [Ferrovibrio sp.]|uniref:tripartite tricarboxylate transporter TctB family protein n=1 Tax=Ferrovibrio sp. TaxID=1917215 RepID=UPI0035AE3C73
MRVLGIFGTDWVASLFAMLVGVFVLFEASSYSMGTTRDMGPGYFPILLGALMIVFGLGILAIEGRRQVDHQQEIAGLRAILMVMLGLSSFALLIERLGMWPALLAACFLSALADREMKLVKAAIIAFCIATASGVIFVYGLGLQVGVFK